MTVIIFVLLIEPILSSEQWKSFIMSKFHEAAEGEFFKASELKKDLKINEWPPDFYSPNIILKNCCEICKEI